MQIHPRRGPYGTDRWNRSDIAVLVPAYNEEKALPMKEIMGSG